MSTSQQVVGHAEYVKGAVVEEVGILSGSDEWKKSGEEQKAAAIQDMRAAAPSADSVQHGSTLGAVEKKAGELLGCEGMEKDGPARAGAAHDAGVPPAGITAGAQLSAVDPSTSAASVSAAAFDSAKLV